MGRGWKQVSHISSQNKMSYTTNLHWQMEYGKRARPQICLEQIISICMCSVNVALPTFSWHEKCRVPACQDDLRRTIFCSSLMHWSRSHPQWTQPNQTKQNQTKAHSSRCCSKAVLARRTHNTLCSRHTSTSTIFFNKIHTYIIKYVYIALCMTAVI